MTSQTIAVPALWKWIRHRTALAVVLAGCMATTMSVTAASAADAETPAKQSTEAEEKSESPALTPEQQKFQERMQNVALVGTFSIDGREDQAPKAERYEIAKVTWKEGDYWTFFARIRYGKNDVTFPITVKLLWAGDTPMVTLTNLTIPPLGTFTARVLFHEHRYAGTWQHGKVGGHMWGRIEPLTEEAPQAPQKPAE